MGADGLGPMPQSVDFLMNLKRLAGCVGRVSQLDTDRGVTRTRLQTFTCPVSRLWSLQQAAGSRKFGVDLPVNHRGPGWRQKTG